MSSTYAVGIGAALLVLVALLVRASRQHYLRIAAAFPEPPRLPHISPIDSFGNVYLFIRALATNSTIGGSGYRVAAAEEGFRIQPGTLLPVLPSLWVPWSAVEECAGVAGIDPGGEANPAGTTIRFKDGHWLMSVADPAGDRLLGYWRLYRRRVSPVAG